VGTSSRTVRLVPTVMREGLRLIERREDDNAARLQAIARFSAPLE
jgi:Arc/MetJ-type ribon-helix-helix transcriptional regulator